MILTFMAVREEKRQATKVSFFKIVSRNQRILSELSRKRTHRFDVSFLLELELCEATFSHKNKPFYRF